MNNEKTKRTTKAARTVKATREIRRKTIQEQRNYLEIRIQQAREFLEDQGIRPSPHLEVGIMQVLELKAIKEILINK